MKVEIKNIKLNLAFSEETTCFKADIFVDGKKAGYASNDGHGGCTCYNAYDVKGRELIEQAEKHFSAMPDIVVPMPNGRTFELKSTLENFIDEEAEKKGNEKEAAKFDRKLIKDCLKYICFKVPNGYRMVSWKNYTVTQLLGTPVGMVLLQKKVDELKEKGEVVLNTNLVGISM